MHFQKRDVSLRLFTTIATLGTPQDITLQELRIESFFPMDEPTAAVFRSWAAGDAGRPVGAAPRAGALSRRAASSALQFRARPQPIDR